VTAPPRYQVVDLGPIQRLASDLAPGLNSHGDMVVWRQNESMAFAPVLWTGREPKMLGIPAGYRNSFAYSVNDSRNAVGWANTTLNPVDSFSVVHAIMLNERGVTDLGTLGGSWSRAYAINDHDVIVGVSELATKQRRAFRYVEGRMSELSPLAGGKSSIAFGINETGSVAGGSEVPHGDSVRMAVHAVLWRDGTPTDLGSLSANGSSLAYAVNNRDEAVGKADLAAGETAFLYSNGKMLDLGIEAGHAFAINDRRQIVGSQQIGEERHPHSTGFLWDNGAFYDLNSCLPEGSPYRIQGAFRINNAGQIAAIGIFKDQLHALLLTPMK
jgi:probable HAF family extracellular repeat protein